MYKMNFSYWVWLLCECHPRGMFVNVIVWYLLIAQDILVWSHTSEDCDIYYLFYYLSQAA